MLKREMKKCVNINVSVIELEKYFLRALFLVELKTI